MKHHSFILFAGLVISLSACKKSSDEAASPSIAPMVVTTLAGSGGGGFANGTGTAASFNEPRGLAVDADGNVYVADYNNNVIRKITPAGVVTTFAGSGSSGSSNGTGTAASFANPLGLTIDANGNLYVGDFSNQLIRKITPDAVVTTLAGGGSGNGTNGTGTTASFSGPAGVAVDKDGNVYVAEQGGLRVRKITPAGVVSTLAGSGSTGAINDTGTAASFKEPYGLAVSSDGTVYLTDASNCMIRKITATGVVTTFAGSGSIGSTDATGLAASFNDPSGVVVDSDGTLYVSDLANSKVRKITADGVVTTFAGSTPGYLDSTGTGAKINSPFAIAMRGNYLYISDSGNQRIRKISK